MVSHVRVNFKKKVFFSFQTSRSDKGRGNRKKKNDGVSGMVRQPWGEKE